MEVDGLPVAMGMLRVKTVNNKKGVYKMNSILANPFVILLGQAFFKITAKTPREAPIERLPTSPMKILAGLRLNLRNAKIAPINAAQNIIKLAVF